MAQNNTEQDKPFCIFCIGELGKMFCDTFADKLSGQSVLSVGRVRFRILNCYK